jgi:hypothetical protein
VRTLDLGAAAAGKHSVTWDGLTDGGSRAPEGTYLPRVVAVDGGGTHYAPAATVNAELLNRFGIRLDVTRPGVDSANPGAWDNTVSATAPVVVDFTEPMYDVGSSSVYLLKADGTRIPATNKLQAGRKRLVITPDRPLPINARITVRITGRARDAAANRHRWETWKFRTARGRAYDPAAQMIVEPGSHTAYLVGKGAALSGPRSGTWTSRSGAHVGHRARLANLPGRWMYVQDGWFAGRWLRESALDHLLGETERRRWDSSTRILFAAGTHTGYRFDSQGNVTASRRGTLAWNSGANLDGRRIINGVAYLSVVNGMWAGYLVPESAVAYRPGRIERIGFPARPRIVFNAGTYTGYVYRSDGSVASRVTATLPHASGAAAWAWAVINGVPHFLVHNGIWAGTWVPETSAIRMET